MIARLLISVCVTIAVSACSSGQGATETTPAAASEDTIVELLTTRSLAATSASSSGLSVVFDAQSGSLALDVLGTDLELNRFSVADFGAFLAMRDATGIHHAYYGEGQGTQIAIYSGGLAGNVGLLASATRVGATEMPLVGQARFIGDYAGFTTTRRVNGRARLDVDFGANTAEGRITDRLLRQRPDNVADVVNPLSDIILEVTDLRADGSFQGETGGGQIVNGQALWNPATGSYVGLVGGPNGREIAGTLTLIHRAPNGSTFEEVGGFLAFD